MIFLWGDELRFGTGSSFAELGLLRVAFVLFSVTTLRRLSEADARGRDRTAGIWLLVGVLVTFVVNSTRPPLQIGHLVIDLVLLMGIYTWLPIPLAAQVAGGLVLATLDLGAVIVSGQGETAARFALAVSFALGSTLGVRSSRLLRGNDRYRFAALQQERRARESMLAALEQVRVLHGLLPICGWCRRIRDDDGSWQTLERYVANHSEAEFTHGICADCAAGKFEGERAAAGQAHSPSGES